MPSIRLMGALALATALCAATVPHESGADDPAITVFVGRSPPSVRWENGKLTGYWVELSRLVVERAGVPSAGIETVPYVRALREIASGDGLCHPFVTRTPAREAHYRWIAPTRRVVISTFVRAGTANAPRSVEMLRVQEVAVQRDTFGDATLSKLGVAATRVIDTNQLAVLLSHGRVTAFVAEYASGVAAADAAGIAVEESMQLSEALGYFACSPSLDDATAARLAQAIKAIFAEGIDRALAAADGEERAYERVRPPIQ